MPAVESRWSELSTDKHLPRSSQSTAALGNTVYIFGGELVARKPRDGDMFRLEADATTPGLEICSTTSLRPMPRVGATMTAIGDKLYVFSGRGGEAMTPINERGAFHVFDTLNSAWTLLTPVDPNAAVPEPRSYHCASTDGRKLIYIHAGCPEKGRLRDLWSFDIMARSWSKLADAPAAPRGGTSTTFSQGKLFRMNGFDGKAEIGGLLDVYDPAEDTWISIGFTADGRAGPGARSVSALLAVSIKSQPHLITLFGEADPSSLGHAGAGKMLSDAWAYSIVDNKWSKIVTDGSSWPTPRGWFDAAALTSNKIVVTGGLANTNERIADAWILELL